ncbi:MAG: M23 family metallopeptidase [Vicinamibacteria bacterium]|nr:M23 family metallopeptidase [Vicinamibacteria bacterium]
MSLDRRARLRAVMNAVIVLTLSVVSVAAVALDSAAAGEIVKQSGSIAARVDVTHARPGGLLVVSVSGHRRGASASAVLLGRRHAFYPVNGRLRALVPVPLGTPPRTTLLGVEVWRLRRRWRLTFDVTIAPSRYGERQIQLSPEQLRRAARPEALRDGRRILGLLRTATPAAHWRGPFKPPVHSPPAPSFGKRETVKGGAALNRLFDGLHDEVHRGLDYIVPSGTIVQAPAAATVLFADTLAATGKTIVLDHGQGVSSVFFHLSRIEVRKEQWIEGRGPIAQSGDSGIVASPTLHWGVYVHGVAIDPRVLFDLHIW